MSTRTGKRARGRCHSRFTMPIQRKRNRRPEYLCLKCLRVLHPASCLCGAITRREEYCILACVVCVCGGEVSRDRESVEIIRLLRQGERDAAVLGLRRDLAAWSETEGGADVSVPELIDDWPDEPGPFVAPGFGHLLQRLLENHWEIFTLVGDRSYRVHAVRTHAGYTEAGIAEIGSEPTEEGPWVIPTNAFSFDQSWGNKVWFFPDWVVQHDPENEQTLTLQIPDRLDFPDLDPHQ